MTEKDNFKKRGLKSAGGNPDRESTGRKSEAGRRSAPAAPVIDGEKAPERISKVLARSGVASRRDSERMILEGRVKVNGKTLEGPAFNVAPTDKIEVDGEEIRGIERTRLWIYHKPSGLVTTNSDPEGRTTVFERLPKDLPRVISIGRLDINTEGLLLLTNDGGLARVLELPATGWLRRYRVRAHGTIDQAELDKLKDGIAVEGVLYGAIEATLDRVQGSNVWITMGLREGKNREIKNVLGALGLEVSRLIRISYGPFQLGEVAEGNVLEVRGRTLREQLGPRLIQEAGANFDAPLYNEKPAEAEEASKASPASWNREKLSRAEKSERGRDRLDTKKTRGGDEEKIMKDVVVRNRASNVWMAPGARPLGPKEKKKAEDKARQDERRDSRRGYGSDRPRGARSDAPRSDGPRRDGPRSEGPRRDGARNTGPRAEGASGKPFVKREDGPSDGRVKSFAKRDTGGAKGPAGGRGKPFTEREDGGAKGPAGGRGKPFAKREDGGGKGPAGGRGKPFTKREDGGGKGPAGGRGKPAFAKRGEGPAKGPAGGRGKPSGGPRGDKPRGGPNKGNRG